MFSVLPPWCLGASWKNACWRWRLPYHWTLRPSSAPKCLPFHFSWLAMPAAQSSHPGMISLELLCTLGWKCSFPWIASSPRTTYSQSSENSVKEHSNSHLERIHNVNYFRNAGLELSRLLSPQLALSPDRGHRGRKINTLIKAGFSGTSCGIQGRLLLCFCTLLFSLYKYSANSHLLQVALIVCDSYSASKCDNTGFQMFPCTVLCFVKTSTQKN